MRQRFEQFRRRSSDGTPESCCSVASILGPRNRIAMADLRGLLAGEDFEDVRTYLQSGNVVLSSSAKPDGAWHGNANS